MASDDRYHPAVERVRERERSTLRAMIRDGPNADSVDSLGEAVIACYFWWALWALVALAATALFVIDFVASTPLEALVVGILMLAVGQTAIHELSRMVMRDE